MFAMNVRGLLLLLLLGFCSCGGKTETPSEAESPEEQTNQQPEEQADPIAAPLAGSPTASGYTDESIRVQIGPDEGLRELLSPSDGSQFLFVRLAVNGPQTLIPADYKVEALGKRFTPHAIGFGRPAGVYSSVESYVGERVELVPKAEDRIIHDGERVRKCELKNPILFLVYDVPKQSSPVLRHGKDKFVLSPNFPALAADLAGSGGTLTAKNQLNLVDPNAVSEDYTVELLNTEKSRLELDSVVMDVIIVTLSLTAEEPIAMEIKKGDLKLGGSSQGRVYFHITNGAGELKAGSGYVTGEAYEGRELIGLDAGGYRVSLTPGRPTNVTMIFRDPKAPGDLDLKLTSTRSVRIPAPANALGRFPPPVEKLPGMVAWAPLVGTPTEAGYLAEQATFAASSKDLASPAPAGPGDGLRYLAVTFRVDAESLFVPIDYRLAEQQSSTVYRPIGVAFGDSGVFVKGLDYEKIPLTFGNSDAPDQPAGRLKGWTLKSRKITLLYEAAPAEEFVFLHGNTQFVIEP